MKWVPRKVFEIGTKLRASCISGSVFIMPTSNHIRMLARDDENYRDIFIFRNK